MRYLRFSIFLSSLGTAVAALLLAPLLLTQVSAQPTGGLDAYDFEELTITSTAVPFAAAKISPPNAPSAKAAACTVETNPLRWRVTGTAPTPTSGMLWPVTTTEAYVIAGINNLNRWQGIATTGTAKVSCTYYR